jgi:hypothetical protein
MDIVETFGRKRSYTPDQLRQFAARARTAMERPFFRDPADRDQLRYFAEWLECQAEAREIGAALHRIGERR